MTDVPGLTCAPRISTRFLLDHHPTEDLWCTTDGFLFVKITVGGYMNAHFDLIEYEEEYWFIGWQPLRAYLDPPRPSPVVEGLREEMYDIEVKLIADDLAVAAWRMHFEMKIRGKAPIGEDVRVSGVLRRKPEGWRYIHWAESPMTAMVYIEKLFQRDVDHEKFAPMIERARARRAAPQ